MHYLGGMGYGGRGYEGGYGGNSQIVVVQNQQQQQQQNHMMGGHGNHGFRPEHHFSAGNYPPAYNGHGHHGMMYAPGSEPMSSGFLPQTHSQGGSIAHASAASNSFGYGNSNSQASSSAQTWSNADY